MKPLKLILSAFFIFLILQKSYSQADVAGAVGHQGFPPTWYLGWNSTTNFPLDIKHGTTNQPIRFFTNSFVPGGLTGERMKIWPGQPSSVLTGGNNLTKISINNDPAFPITTPRSWLHLGDDANSFNGNRIWMERGIFMSSGFNTLYMGFVPDNNRQDALINWGQNTTNPLSLTPANLRFNFTSGLNDATDEGLEVARMTSLGNMGIGPSFTNPVPPQRRLDVFHNSAPQFRLTQTQDALLNSGIFTDFQTTPAGHLFINPSFNGSSANSNVGLGIFDPTEKIDVDGNGRFRNVPSITPHPNNVLITGFRSAAGSNDVTLRKLAFTGDPTQVLLGTGVFGAAPNNGGGSVTANNGLGIFPAGSSNVQWGRQTGTVGTAGNLIQNTDIPLNGFNLVFRGNGTPGVNNVGIGTGFTNLSGPKRGLDLYDDVNPQFRLTQALNTNLTGGSYTDFKTTDLGSLLLNPSGTLGVNSFVGINLSGTGIEVPSETLDVNGNGRFRTMPNKADNETNVIVFGKVNSTDDVSLRKLPLTNNPTDVLLGTGNFGPASALFVNLALANANNGLSVDPMVPGTVQMGGTLIKNTDIPLSGNLLTFSGTGKVGIGTAVPTIPQGLEVKGLPGLSGLRFTELNSNSTSMTNGTNKVLSLNPSGDVILVNDATGTGGGAVTANNGVSIDPLIPNNVQLGGTLIYPTEINLNDKSLALTGNQIGSRLGIGTIPTNAKVQIFNSQNQYGSYLNVDATGIASYSAFGSYISVMNKPSGNQIGQYITTQTNSATLDNYGVYTEARGNNHINVGIESFSGGNVTGENVGLISRAEGTGLQNVGAEASAYGNGVENFGIKVSANQGTTNYGIYASGPSQTANWAGYFNGNVHSTGTITSVSDQQFKQNITDIPNATLILSRLRPRNYYFDSSAFPRFHFSSLKQWGLIAQQVETVLPELVSKTILPADYDSLGNQTAPPFVYKALNYTAFIPILIKGAQEQQAIIDSLRALLLIQNASISSLQNDLLEIKNALGLSNPSNAIAGKNAAANSTSPAEKKAIPEQATLNQNVPNPFSKITNISYGLPTAGKVEIKVFSITGNMVALLINENKKAGNYSVQWDATNQPAGMYTYALLINGKQISKKALKVN